MGHSLLYISKLIFPFLQLRLLYNSIMYELMDCPSLFCRHIYQTSDHFSFSVSARVFKFLINAFYGRAMEKANGGMRGSKEAFTMFLLQIYFFIM
jgi:hypothetical protein